MKRAQKDSVEVAALVHDRLHSHPQDHTHNNRGEPVFSQHSAHHLLREDVKNKKHEGMPPSSFQMTRPEYMHFKPRIFKERIYQEVWREKFINHLEQDRAQKEAKRKNKAEKRLNKKEKDKAVPTVPRGPK